MNKRHLVRVVGVGLTVFFTALVVYDRPPELALYWQPALQGVLAALAQFGFNRATLTPNPQDWRP